MTLSSSEPLLKFNITKRFDRFTLKCEATLDQGITAVLGPSGSGKTTLLNCISGMVRPDEGEIQVLGSRVFSSLSSVNVPPERRRFGYVFQDVPLFPHMTVRANIMYGYNLTANKHRKIHPEQLVSLLQLSHLMERGVANLSGGERQRVVLARALATSPKLLLLDEPLASLDWGFRGVIIEYLKRIHRELRTPMVYVSHSISEAMTLAETVLVLSSGSLVLHGKAAEVLVHPILSSLADYSALENLLEARVSSCDLDEGVAELTVGCIKLMAPKVRSLPGDSAMISIKAGEIILSIDMPPRMSVPNIVPATIEEIHVLRDRVLVYADVGERLVVEISPAALKDLQIRSGQRVFLAIKTSSITVLEAPGQVSSPLS